MGGRENPNEIWKTSYYCVEPPATGKDGDAKVLGPCIRSSCPAKDTCRYYPFPTKVSDRDEFTTSEIRSKICKTPIEAYNAVLKKTTKGNAPPLYQAIQAMEKDIPLSARHIVRTLKQGFYINDSINELMMRFGDSELTQKDSAWSIDNAAKSHSEYNPAIRVTGNSNPILVGIQNVFDNLEKDASSVSYCTFACIRSTLAFFEDTLNTLKFASQVNSVVSKTTTTGAVATSTETPQPSLSHKQAFAISSSPANRVSSSQGLAKRSAASSKDRQVQLQPLGGGKRTRRRRNLPPSNATTVRIKTSNSLSLSHSRSRLLNLNSNNKRTRRQKFKFGNKNNTKRRKQVNKQ